ncbi:dTDP-4-dehydrorhamnose reductase [Massilia norwichensis]|uniref:dTDP-4-dehydrorhamnose reductase n=1 Tax=Massilia norwichensis TaxID=1442366 RepID=A0ABT2A5F2_9BURK|nr:dTDP-4-dehydrorhamnose reductase [Massilia norwichensis]MCS0589427.1 dTDP-4-dehydrorhamnose reductase [Massilia norwichensis]
MKILLTGKDGQVGFELVRALAPLGEVLAVGRADCDLGDTEALRVLVRTAAPDIIVNAAAYTAVDKAEAESDLAFAVNARAPGILGEEAARLRAMAIHYSTDYVFDGAGHAPWTEADAPQPQNVYGRSKLAGERALAEACPRHAILRTSWVLGSHGGNFAKTMLRLAAERDRLNVVDDQVGAPTSAALLADLTAHLIRQFAREGANAFPYGTYHVAAAGETSWCAYARFVLEAAQQAGCQLRARPDALLPVTSAAYSAVARRPANSRLDTSLFRQTFGLRLPPWQDGVREVLRHLLRSESDA